MEYIAVVNGYNGRMVRSNLNSDGQLYRYYINISKQSWLLGQKFNIFMAKIGYKPMKFAA